MRIAKRVMLFVSVNILIVATLSLMLGALGVRPSIGGASFDWSAWAGFALVWGFWGAFLSLALSRLMARWMMGVQIIDPRGAMSSRERYLVDRVYTYSRSAGLKVMPWVGIYPGAELNAFATGPTKNRALVAVSSGLLESMDQDAIDGVLAHEVAHVANGDMVTMTLIQGVVNAFVMFLARIVAWFAGQLVAEEKRPLVQAGVVLAFELGLGVLGMLVVASFSRAREFRADFGGAALAGPAKMIAALRGLKSAQLAGDLHDNDPAPALASLKISGKADGFMRLLSTHPDLEERIERLEELRYADLAQARRIA